MVVFSLFQLVVAWLICSAFIALSYVLGVQRGDELAREDIRRLARLNGANWIWDQLREHRR